MWFTRSFSWFGWRWCERKQKAKKVATYYHVSPDSIDSSQSFLLPSQYTHFLCVIYRLYNYVFMPLPILLSPEMQAYKHHYALKAKNNVTSRMSRDMPRYGSIFCIPIGCGLHNVWHWCFFSFPSRKLHSATTIRRSSSGSGSSCF